MARRRARGPSKKIRKKRYVYRDKNTGYFVAKGTVGARRYLQRRSPAPRRDSKTGRFIPRTQPQRDLQKRSKSAGYLGERTLGDSGLKRYVYEVPFTYTKKNGLTLDKKAIDRFIKEEEKIDPNVLMAMFAEMEFKSEVERGGWTKSPATPDRHLGIYVWMRASRTYLANGNGNTAKMIKEAILRVQGSRFIRMVRVHIHFARLEQQ